MANPNYEGNTKSGLNDPSFNPPPPPYGAGPVGSGMPHYGATGMVYPQQPGITISSNPNMPTQTVIISSATCGIGLGPDPSVVHCPTCNQQVVSVVEYENGTLTWLWVGGLCFLGCWLGCCLIPTCINDLRDVLHTCPNCKNFLGRYRRLR